MARRSPSAELGLVAVIIEGGLIAPEHWQPAAREALRIALVNLAAEPAPAAVADAAARA